MKTTLHQPTLLRILRLTGPSFAAGLLLLVGLPLARAAKLSRAELTTVFSTVHNGYQREKLSDGSLKPVRYTFGEGTFDPGGIGDLSLDRLKFGQLAVLLTAPLAKQGYQPGRDLNAIDEVIVVHWGRTIGWDTDGYGNAHGTLNQTYSTMKSAFPDLTPGMQPPGAGQATRTRGLGGTPGAANDMDNMLLMLSMQEDARNRTNAHNARMLGYHHTLSRLPTFYGNLVSPDRGDLVDELEDDRYYVILAAYDFRAMQKDRQPKLLWITRFSLQARGNDFDRSINGMAYAAASYFGRASDGLRREQPRDGTAVPGELEVINYEEPKK